MKVNNVKHLVLTAVLAAIIIVMTIIPYTGYISYGIALEITTLHIIVILGATLLGWKSGMVLGSVWGITCMLRALTNPLWQPFVNPLVSLIPRIIVGLVAAVVFSALTKGKTIKDNNHQNNIPDVIALVITTIVATLTNTILVLTSYYVFGGMISSYRAIFDLMKTILGTIIATNGVVELVIAIIFVPILYKVLSITLSKQTK